MSTSVPTDTSLVGRAVAEVPWPRDCVLVAIERDGALLVPRGPVRLQAGDRVSLFATPGSEQVVRALLALAPESEAGMVPGEPRQGGRA